MKSIVVWYCGMVSYSPILCCILYQHIFITYPLDILHSVRHPTSSFHPFSSSPLLLIRPLYFFLHTLTNCHMLGVYLCVSQAFMLIIGSD